ncbi:Phox-domain containing protein [Niveomyces insectorum RCEF 264]|uniref:Sorting nexin MVP1 n=1 Tax=Niveomyces insectorum RCEF 264 TaxID=1081102 RepID=A0A167YMH0_9HYPO|nr:Phox-domain containing protein [Niveomyces insectorum RCEF 264]
MALFGSTPPEETPSMHSSFARSRHGLFEDDATITRTNSDSLFNDDEAGSGTTSPWDLPTPRKQKSRAELLQNLLPTTNVPDTYVEAFDAVVRDETTGQNKVSVGGVARTLAASKLDADNQAKILGIVAPGGARDTALSRNEFNVLLALIGLAQEDLPRPNLFGLVAAASPIYSPATPTPPQTFSSPPPLAAPSLRKQAVNKASMDFTADDPWNTPDVHKNHQHTSAPPFSRSSDLGGGPVAAVITSTATANNGNGSFAPSQGDTVPVRTTSNFTTTPAGTVVSTSTDGTRRDVSSDVAGHDSRPSWNMYNGGENTVGGGFGDLPSSAGVGRDGHHDGNPNGAPHARHTSRTIGSGRTGNAIEEYVTVTLMPEKEGLFMFQHHNYEVVSSRRGSKVVRRYSDFVWLLECLHKRFPFRVLPLLPSKRVAVNGNHLSNDGAFIEKRRRGLARFLNALVRHPVLSSEQLVAMFLTVPTELSVWRKQATISVQDEFAGRPLPPGLEESLPPHLSDLFDQTRSGVRRSAELYITACGIMDRLVKRGEGVANDHARLAVSLQSLTEVSADTYATDTNDVPLLNDGLIAMSKHLRTGQSLMEDEAKAWDEGVLEDLKRQRDALVGLRDLFDRRERYDRDNIPFLERRIQKNEAKLAALRAKPEGLAKPGEIEKVVEAIIKDKESIVTQHNRSVFVKECLRDELIYFQSSQYHVSRWNQDWAQERVKYAEMLSENWRRLLDELDGMPLGD